MSTNPEIPDDKAIAVIGLGYVGLPLACLSAKNGLKVYGLDLNKKIVELTNQGKSHLHDPVVEKMMESAKGKILATTDPKSAIPESDVVIVCVPTPVTEKKLPDLKPLELAVNTVAENLKPNQLVIIESTIYPGVMEEIVKPIFEKINPEMRVGKDFHLVHCPERIDPGNKKWTLEKIPRVLGGFSEEGVQRAKKFYSKILDPNTEIRVLNSVRAAEAVKITENTFRDINIAFVNELARSFDKLGIDVSEVIAGASTKPFGYMPFYPGPGVGGHCISIDPYYLIERAKKAGFTHRFLVLAREINDSMANYVVELLKEKLKESRKTLQDSAVALLGLSYKENIDDLRESPALRILELLEKDTKDLRVFDPFFPEKSSVKSLDGAVNGADAIVLATAHKQFLEELTPDYLSKHKVLIVIDARNKLNSRAIKEKGIIYKGIGR